MKLIDKDALVTEIERRRDAALTRQKNLESIGQETVLNEMIANELNRIISFTDTLEVKGVDISNISENLAEAYEYLDYTSTGNLAHNKPMVSARLKKAIRGLFDAGLFELTHDEKYRMENLGIKAQKGEEA